MKDKGITAPKKMSSQHQKGKSHGGGGGPVTKTDGADLKKGYKSLSGNPETAKRSTKQSRNR